ncbi:MAG: hypothetical protein ACI959_000655 [Limisphaerales bacterium]|jgi:hypothetical protein
MYKKYLLIGGFAILQFIAKAQGRVDSIAQKVKHTQIEAVYGHYLQDGENSAVTGGIGTEELTVFSPSVKINHTTGAHSFLIKGGTDVITSASTDNINAVLSTASLKDSRIYSQLQYENTSSEKVQSVYVGTGFSFESDYLSFNFLGGFSKSNTEKGRSGSLEIQYFQDDLRWGRLSRGFFSPVKLVYPLELRYKDWHDEYLRRSYNIRGAYTQVLNKRNVIGVFPDFTWQKGLLATPFHRVYFNDGTLRVEELPDSRAKVSLGLRLNTFVGGRLILKNSINPYWDNFGISGMSLENEIIIKLRPNLNVSSYLRGYLQEGSDYFKPYRLHDPGQEFYTSDYDLADLKSFSVGTGLKYYPDNKPDRFTNYESVSFKYMYMIQSNGLSAHIMSCVIQLSMDHSK